MLMKRKFKFHFHPISLMTVSPYFPPPLTRVYAWLTSNRLSVNPSKTEFLIIGNPQQRNKIQSSSIVFCGKVISPSEFARNLGVTSDSSLSLTKHISSICKSAYYQIRQLRQIRSFLDISSAIILANSLVISKLDYCNSLLNGLPKSSINRLQVVQNFSLARTIYPSAKRSDHISPVLHKLHWLPVSSRIEFNIATLTFKVLKFQQPAYIYDLIAPYIQWRIQGGHGPPKRWTKFFFTLSDTNH